MVADAGAALFLQQVALLQCGLGVGGKGLPHSGLKRLEAQFPALQMGRSDFIIP